MGAGASTGEAAPFASEEAALAAGKTQEEIEAWKAANPTAESPAAAAEETPAAPASAAGAETIDRSEIERNANGSEEPSSAAPELWNIDNTEVDILVKYKMGGQMWYVQSRMRENTAKGKPIPGFPMNQKAIDAKRYYATDDGEVNAESTNFGDSKFWKAIEAENPPVAA